MRPTNENICPSAIVDGSELTIRCTISIDAKEAVTRDFAKGLRLPSFIFLFSILMFNTLDSIRNYQVYTSESFLGG